jgi:hypothetical protein
MGDLEKSNERSAPSDKLTFKDFIKLGGYSGNRQRISEVATALVNLLKQLAFI